MARAKSDNDKQQLLRQLPRVDALVADEALAGLRRRLGERTITRLGRTAVAQARQAALDSGVAPTRDAVLARVAELADAVLGSRARRVINATGVVLHTNLGRAPLSEAAASALADSAAGYTSIELDLASGRRGARGAFAEQSLAQLTGAEDALVVNNNAAAVLLVLTALASGKGVVVSRGEQVEIGGGFRVPDVLARSGAEMIEVGTTNRTRLADYERVLDSRDDVAVLLRVHPGNFRQTGFVERPPLKELAKLARDRGVLLVKDLGGGALIDLAELGLMGEPMAQSCVEDGAHLVCFSCDKVLGGPQGGAIVGDAKWVNVARRDPLARAVRLGRLPLVALEATLESYLTGDHDAVPALRMMRSSFESVRERAARWCRLLAERGVKAHVLNVNAAVGGGALAEEPLKSAAAVIDTDGPDALAEQLRRCDPPVMARIHDGQVLLDGRTVMPSEEEDLLDGVVAAVMRAEAGKTRN